MTMTETPDPQHMAELIADATGRNSLPWWREILKRPRTEEDLQEIRRAKPADGPDDNELSAQMLQAALEGNLPIRSAILLDLHTLRILDAKAFRRGLKCLDFRANAVASDSGLHILTIDDFDRVDSGETDTPVDNPLNPLHIRARVWIQPGMNQPDRRIRDTLHVQFGDWMHSELADTEVHAYCGRFQIPGITGRLGYVGVDEPASDAELEELSWLFDAIRAGATGDDAQFPADKEVGVRYHVGEEVTYA